jgi:hypothetical protein
LTALLADIGVVGHRLADLALPETPRKVILHGLVTRALTQATRQTHRRPARHWLAMDAQARRVGRPVPAFQPGQMRNVQTPRVVVGRALPRRLRCLSKVLSADCMQGL